MHRRSRRRKVVGEGEIFKKFGAKLRKNKRIIETDVRTREYRGKTFGENKKGSTEGEEQGKERRQSKCENIRDNERKIHLRENVNRL